MSGLADGLSMFCEHCGAHRDQIVLGGSMRACPTCAQAVCPNCWNLTADACLACVPFALAEAPAKSERRRKAAAAGPAVVGMATSPNASLSPLAAATTPASKASRRRGPTTGASSVAASDPPADPVWPTAPTGPLMFPSDPPDPPVAPVGASVAAGRARASRHASRALVRLGLATVAASVVAVGAVAFTLASWSGHGGPAIVDAGAAMSPAPVAPAVATPSPTRKPTPKPTHKPTAKPRATPRPTAKPKPTHRPTPKPTRQPTPKPAPLAAFLSCSVSDFTVSCTGDASRSGATFFWKFGDGSRGSGEIASHIYARPGVYRVDLTVKVGSATASDSTSATITAP